MKTAPRLLSSLLLSLLCYLPAWAQTNQTIDARPAQKQIVTQTPIIITATAVGQRVRCVALGEVNQTRLQVFSTDGSPLFDSDYRLGNLVDWKLADQHGQSLTDGSYLFLVTTKDFSGSLTQKYGIAQLEQGAVILQQSSRDELPQPQATALQANQLSTSIAPVDRLSVAAIATLSIEGATVSDTTVGGQNQTKTKKSTSSTNIAGTGTQNQVAKWIDNAGTLGDSAITEVGGNVGIGLSNPAAPLHIFGSTETVRQSLSNTNSYIQFAFFEGGVKKGAFGYQGSTSTGLVGGPSAMVFGTLTNSPVAFFTNGDEKVRLDVNGNFGIGTSTPVHRLALSGGPGWTTDFWSGALELQNAAAIGWRANPVGNRFGIVHSTGGLYFFHTATELGTTGGAANYDIVINDSGNITQPTSKYGLIKAMAYINENGTIDRCYNSTTNETLAGGGTSTTSCSISVSQRFNPATQVLIATDVTFNFTPNYWSVTPATNSATSTGAIYNIGVMVNRAGQTLNVITYFPERSDNETAAPFVIILY
jgi:hypothetical protein